MPEDSDADTYDDIIEQQLKYGPEGGEVILFEIIKYYVFNPLIFY